MDLICFFPVVLWTLLAGILFSRGIKIIRPN
jgi:hypothetical protein